jgi:hypothetical protein
MPASPRSPRSATGKAGEPLDKLLAAVEAAGYAVELKQAVSAHGVNPTRVDLRLGTHFTKLLIYSWFITLEGHGRAKDDFRIQTTRAHDGPLKKERSRVSVGVGWRLEADVFVAFDAWAKRYTGSSSSVHIRRALIEAVLEDGGAQDGPRHDPRYGFAAANAIGFVQWAHALDDPKVAVLAPHDWTRVDDNNAVIVGKVHATQPTSWVREKDRLIIINTNKRIADDALWQIRSLTPVEAKTEAGRPRRFIRFECRRLGKVEELSRETIESLL